MFNEKYILNQIATNPEYDRVSAPYNGTLFLSRKGKLNAMIKEINRRIATVVPDYVVKITIDEPWYKSPVGGHVWVLTRTDMIRLRTYLETAKKKGTYPVSVSRSTIKYQPIANFVSAA